MVRSGVFALAGHHGAGLYRLNSIALLILTAIIVVIDLCLFNFGFRRFTAEKLLTRPPEKPRKEKTNVY